MRANPTDAERRLWSMLRDRRMPSFKFRRQLVIAPYIVDSVCLERRLIIEADGSQHLESAYDERRDTFLRAQSFDVLRFWNNDVLARSSGVFDVVFAALTTPLPPTAKRRREQTPPHGVLLPSPARGEGLEGMHRA